MNTETEVQSAAGCGCAMIVSKNLEEKFGARLAYGFYLDEKANTLKGRVLLRLERIGSGRKALPSVSAVFCPFCGTKSD